MEILTLIKINFQYLLADSKKSVETHSATATIHWWLCLLYPFLLNAATSGVIILVKINVILV